MAYSAEYHKEWRAKNREHVAKYQAQYHQENKERTRAARLEADARYGQRLKQEVIQAYGGACVCCKSNLLIHLTIDHIEGGGRLERKTLNNASSRRIWAKLRREDYPNGYQVMCFNCNFAKHVEGRCPCQDRDR